MDMRAALRSFLRHPRLAIGVIATLAAGIAASVLVFAVLDAVVLRPLPYRDPESLAMLWTDDVKRGIHEEGVGLPTVLDWRAQSRLFEDFAVCGRGYPVTLSDQSEPERIDAGVVSANLWSLLGVAPSLGRAFTQAEDLHGERVAVISHGFWLRRFGGKADALGREIALNGRPYRVIGVMRESFHFPAPNTQIWIPLPDVGPYANLRDAREQDYFKVVGRLRPGHTLAAAQAEMNQIGRRIAEAHPSSDPDFAGYGVSVFPFSRQYVGDTLPAALWLLFGAVGLVLMVACANAAGLLLARNAALARELAVRSVLGADAGTLVRAQLYEAILLALTAGIAGSLLGWALLRGTIAAAAGHVPRLAEATIDLRVLLFAAIAAAITAIVAGSMAATRAARINPADALRAGGRGVAASHRGQWWLVAAQAALAVVLLTGSGLLIRSLLALRQVSPGFEARGAVLAAIDRSWTPASTASTPVFWRSLLDRLNTLPGARAGAISNFLITMNPDYAVSVEGRATVYNEKVTGDRVTPQFFQAAGVRLLAGRLFNPEDYAAEGMRGMIINQSMARRFWPGENAVGKRLQFGRHDASRPWVTVIGVVEDMKRLGLESSAVCEAFGPGYSSAMELVVRADPPRPSLATEVRAVIRQVDAAVPVQSIVPLDRLLDESKLPRRLQTGLLAAFAALTLLLAAVGLFATLQQVVAGRRREFGIRLALGAQPSEVLRLVLTRGLLVAGAGATVGIAASLMLARTLEALLFGIPPYDIAALAAAPAAMLAAALAAAAVPAWRAARVEPARVLTE